MREYLFIAGQSVPAINRRLEIPPDVILGEIKAIPTLSPTLSCQVCIIFHRAVLSPPALRRACEKTAKVCSRRGAGGAQGRGDLVPGCAPRARPGRGKWGLWGSLLGGTPSQRGFGFACREPCPWRDRQEIAWLRGVVVMFFRGSSTRCVRCQSTPRVEIFVFVSGLPGLNQQPQITVYSIRSTSLRTPDYP